MGVEYQFTTVNFVCFSFDLVFTNPLIMNYKDSLPFSFKVLLLFSLGHPFILNRSSYAFFKSQFLSILLLTVGDTHQFFYFYIVLQNTIQSKFFNVIGDLESIIICNVHRQKSFEEIYFNFKIECIPCVLKA